MSKTILAERHLSDLLIVWADTARRSEDERRCAPNVRAVIFYAVVSDDIQRVIEFFPDRQAAEAMLAEVLGDEPERRDVLHVERDPAFHRNDELAGARVADLRGNGGRGAYRVLRLRLT